MAANTPEISQHSHRLARFLAEGHLVTVHTEDEALAAQAAFAALPEATRRRACAVTPLSGRTWLLQAAVPRESRGEA